jgi:hypothetical protein
MRTSLFYRGGSPLGKFLSPALYRCVRKKTAHDEASYISLFARLSQSACAIPQQAFATERIFRNGVLFPSSIGVP